MITVDERTWLSEGVSTRIRESEIFDGHYQDGSRYNHGVKLTGENNVSVRFADLTPDQLQELLSISKSCRHKALTRVVNAIIECETAKVPNFQAAHAMIVNWFRKRATNAWLYKKEKDGMFYPRVVTEVVRKDPSERQRQEGDRPYVEIRTEHSSIGERSSTSTNRISFHASELIHRTVDEIITDTGYVFDDPDAHADYLGQVAHYEEQVAGRFSDQFRIDRNTDENNVGFKAILTTEDETIPRLMRNNTMSQMILDEDDASWGARAKVPVHMKVQIFRLDQNDFETVHTGRMTPYVYDKDLVNKLILPETHMDMLDVLTTGTDAFLTDVIEGKSAGNVILCRGRPGLGKTLTAEVYSELVEKPLYSVHSGDLGSTASSVDKNLRVIFERSQKWDCVMLLDEADVFVRERGLDLEQNAIVAVFLRTLEYFTGLMFMTTNRSEEVDDAIISRCSALISYEQPSREDRFQIWHVLAKQNGITLDDSLVGNLVAMFPKVSARDIKHLLRMALRVAASKDHEVDIDLFRRCAQFRAVDIVAIVPKLAMPPDVAQDRVRLPPGVKP